MNGAPPISLPRRLAIVLTSLALSALLFHRQVATALVTRGDEFLQRGRVERANLYYSRALTFDTRSSIAADRSAFAGILLRTPHALDAAERAASLGLAAHPDDADLLMDRGLCYQLERRYAEAALDFGHAARLRGEHACIISRGGTHFAQATRALREGSGARRSPRTGHLLPLASPSCARASTDDGAPAGDVICRAARVAGLWRDRRPHRVDPKPRHVPRILGGAGSRISGGFAAGRLGRSGVCGSDPPCAAFRDARARARPGRREARNVRRREPRGSSGDVGARHGIRRRWFRSSAPPRDRPRSARRCAPLRSIHCNRRPRRVYCPLEFDAVTRAARLPLGIDIGRAGIRIAELVLDAGLPHLRRVHAHVHDQPPAGDCHLGQLIADTLKDAKVTERRCVLAVGEPDATIRTVAFPPMPPRERDRAAGFEASRFVDYARAEACVRTRPLDGRSGLYALGILRRARLRSLQAVARAARLRVIAIDHESYGLRRSLPHADAILDIGHLSSRLYIFGSAAPLGAVIDGGAQEFTHAIARGLDIDAQTAERRKRTVGLAGSASEALAAFTHSVGRAILSARGQGACEVEHLILAGNGARLPGLVDRLERDTGCAVEIAGTIAIERSAYPPDVVRASAPDWSLSVGLALWTLVGG